MQKFTKAEIEAMLGAAGLNLASIQQTAAVTLEGVIDASNESIEANQLAIREAQAEIGRATVDLNKAKATFKVVKAIGG